MSLDDNPDAFDADKPPLPLEKTFYKTTVDELLALAASLVADEAASKAINRVGLHDELTSSEEKVLQRAIADHVRREGWRARDPLALQLGVTLARWFVAGEIASIEGPDARAFLDDRFFYRRGDQSGILTKKPTVTEVLWVARALMANSTYWAKIQEVGEFGGIDEKFWADTMRPIEDAIIIRYGLVNRSIIGASGVLRQTAAGTIDNLDSPAAREFVHGIFVRDRAEEIDIQWQLSNGWLLYDEGQYDDALKAIGIAAAAEDQAEPAPGTPDLPAPAPDRYGAMLLERYKHPVLIGFPTPASEVYGAMLLDRGRAKEALSAFEATLIKAPNRFSAMLGAARAAAKSGDDAKARQHYCAALALAAAADPAWPEIADARAYIARAR